MTWFQWLLFALGCERFLSSWEMRPGGLTGADGTWIAALAVIVLCLAVFGRREGPERYASIHWLILAGTAPFATAGAGGMGDWPGNAALAFVTGWWLFAWLAVDGMVRAREGMSQRVKALLVPFAFGLSLLALWELTVTGLGISPILLPAPSAIWVTISTSLPILWTDFKETFLQGVLAGYAIGCIAGFMVAIAIDRSPFLQRGLLPIGNLAAALPIVGIAPIMVKWFGFGWESKAGVVVLMTFFPMLVNTVAGLAAADRMQRDLMRTYAASYPQTLIKLRLPAAAPFIFNALKINSTLALIGAIVAEFFGSPTQGMGFRINTEAGKMALDMVWAEIAVAALAGSAFYGAVTLIEKAATFWHPSQRRRG